MAVSQPGSGMPAVAGAGRRRGPSKGDLKEAAILDTAWRLLGEKPLGAITIEDLAKGAGISRSSFYFYFESKDAVVLDLATRLVNEIRDQSAAFFQGSGATEAELRKSIAAYLARWREKGAVLRAMMTLEQGDDSLRRLWAKVSDELLDEAAAAIERDRAAGILAPGPPDARDLARVLAAMLWRIGYEVSLTPMSRAEEQRLVETLTIVFSRAVVPLEPE